VGLSAGFACFNYPQKGTLAVQAFALQN